ncbi:DNA polymerase subunit gamma-2, mitochondrial [Schistocerca nitens]|uniref:DNA polymerase subunit gamma-2, mitochondrial n=1 Tax=Schistocerca nitens TaxID=7011 RepID=UPI002117C2D4|nr:DNA polymerase subunit gamma-2, mitochondrial [Schistocerca nitens]
MQKILQICERHSLAKPIFSENSLYCMKFGPVGELLKKFLCHEWLHANVISSEIGVFPHYVSRSDAGHTVHDLKEAYEYVRNLNSGQLPFGVVVETPNLCADKYCEKQQHILDESLYFYPKKCTLLKTFMFVAPSKATHFYYQWQRHRKMWWRKFSACPSRFVLSDVQNNEKSQSVHIQANFPWGSQNVETLSYWTTADQDLAIRTVFEAKDGRKKVTPHIVESTLSVECAVFTFLCDAYDETAFAGLPREVMRFHRKLAPFKLSFSASASSSSAGEELNQLAVYLTKQTRDSGISTLLLPDLVKKSLESQFVRNDELGIPYTAVLNDTSLKNGIITLRNRDTTLKEQVHISKLREYMEKILKNY